MTAASVKLLPGRDKSLRHRHPWVFSGAVASVTGDPEAGAVVDVVDGRGAFLARGYYNEQSRIRVRVLAWDGEAIDDAFWHARVVESVRRRAPLAVAGQTDAFRLVHAEADRLPGLVVDRYGDVLVVQFLTAGVERARAAIISALIESTGAGCIFERSDTASRAREGLTAAVGCVHGTLPAGVDMLENGIRFRVNVETGQKTGFYLDQRLNRAVVAPYARGGRMLDAFCHSGAFGIGALRAGAASAVFVDSSTPALEALRVNLAANDIDPATCDIRHADVFETLRALRDGGERFDLVTLDPPKFAMSRHQLDKALRAYKDINMVAMELLSPGGLLATFSCSQAVDTASFTMAVSWAGIDARRDVQVLRRLGQGEDHPVLASFPESEYLKGLLCRIV
ncbi:MAG TPA: class I SAM-dependent rRNA methyltransferase [Candidatus Krumholzibacteria bacterium]|nr:class I SAM-dependent rRNA methyltransferase [Candidatus Krumholzibacteria bacterium]